MIGYLVLGGAAAVAAATLARHWPDIRRGLAMMVSALWEVE